jgi:hypothetical protein
MLPLTGKPARLWWTYTESKEIVTRQSKSYEKSAKLKSSSSAQHDHTLITEKSLALALRDQKPPNPLAAWSSSVEQSAVR